MNPWPVKIPGYWMNETSGVLRDAVEKYLGGGELEAEEIEVMRAYLGQWLLGFAGPDVAFLRGAVARIASTRHLQNVIADMVYIGIDPL